MQQNIPTRLCGHSFPLTLWQSSQPSRAHWESPVAPKEQPLHTACVSHCQGLASSMQALPQPPQFVFKEWDFLRLSSFCSETATWPLNSILVLACSELQGKKYSWKTFPDRWFPYSEVCLVTQSLSTAKLRLTFAHHDFYITECYEIFLCELLIKPYHRKSKSVCCLCNFCTYLSLGNKDQ